MGCELPQTAGRTGYATYETTMDTRDTKPKFIAQRTRNGGKTEEKTRSVLSREFQILIHAARLIAHDA